MARSQVRQHDIIRVLRSAIAAGLQVSGYEVDPATGTIRVTTVAPGSEQQPANDLNRWLAEHAHQA